MMVYTYEEVLQASEIYFNGDDLAAKVFVDKYALRDGHGNYLEKTPSDMHRRLAKEFARIESAKFKNPLKEEDIYDLLDQFKYIIPQGSVLYGCGNNHQIVSLSNCYVVNSPEDSYGGILNTDEQLVQISKRRGGVGIDLSNLRPAGSPTKNSSRHSTGIKSWMRRYSNSTREVGQDGRRGALMLTLNCVAKGSMVWTLNGKIPIENLVNTNPLVYCTDTFGNVYIRRANKVWSNGIKETVRIRFDNDEHLVCTADHKIMLKDGSYKNAIDLNMGDSVCTLTKRLDKKYFRLGVAGSRKLLAEHVIVGEYKYGRYPTTQVNDRGWISEESEEIHHVDENTLNNHPDNLLLLTRKEHRLMHNNFKEHLDRGRQIVSDKRRGKTWDEFYGKEKADEIRKKKSKSLKNNGKEIWNKGLTGEEYTKHYENGFSNQFTENPNHKVVSVEKWHAMEVFDISVPEFNNFVVNDVFVHNCHHPDILEFINIKNDPLEVTGANISVKYTNEFLKAVENNIEYELRFPVNSQNVIAKISAKSVWDAAVHSAWNRAEPGILFEDNIINYNAIDCYSEDGFNTVSTNPCSELPLCIYDSCRLLIQNLFSYVENPFTDKSHFRWRLFKKHAIIAQRLMDDLIDLEIEKIHAILAKLDKDPEEYNIKSREINLWNNILHKCINGRRTGLGITGTGDMLAALNIKYGSEESIDLIYKIHQQQKFGSYLSSVKMAKELGPFPIWNWNKEKNSLFLLNIKKEYPDLYYNIQRYGRRNIGNLTIAPTGSMSLLTQTTSGIEPLFMIQPYKRRKKINPSDKNARVDFVDASGDSWQEFDVIHPKLRLWMEITGETDWKLSPWFGCCAEDLDWQQRVKLQAAAQKHIDHAISSTLNLPEDVSKERVDEIFRTAWKSGCKGITVYRKNCRTGVLVEKMHNEISTSKFTKRPKELICDIYHVIVKGKQHTVCISLLDDKPYEVLVIGEKTGRSLEKGKIVKRKRGWYDLYSLEGELLYENMTGWCTTEEANVTRLVSTGLRHSIPVDYLVNQLTKMSGDINSFSRSISRCLKNYIPDNTNTNEKCSECENRLVYQEGCLRCLNCGYSKCG